MHIFRSLILTAVWPSVTLFYGVRSSFGALIMLIAAILVGVAVSFLVPASPYIYYTVAIYILGAAFFWPVITTDKRQATNMILNLGFCGLFIGSLIVAAFKFF